MPSEYCCFSCQLCCCPEDQQRTVHFSIRPFIHTITWISEQWYKIDMWCEEIFLSPSSLVHMQLTGAAGEWIGSVCGPVSRDQEYPIFCSSARLWYIQKDKNIKDVCVHLRFNTKKTKCLFVLDFMILVWCWIQEKHKKTQTEFHKIQE